MGASGAAAAVLGTRLGLMAKEGLAREIAWKKMVVLASSLWFFITSTLAFFFRFLAARVFRPKREEETCKVGCSSSTTPMVSIAKAGETDKFEEEGGEEEEESVFQFRFSFQIPEQSNNNGEVLGGSTGIDGESPMTTSVSNYRFFSSRDYRGFVEAPQAMTLCVQESYMGSDGIVQGSREEVDRELQSRLSSVKSSRRGDSGVGEAEELDVELKNRLSSVRCTHQIHSDVGTMEKLDKELKNRFSSVKSTCSSGQVDSDTVGVAEELDRELKNRLFSAMLSGQYHTDVGAALCQEQEHSSVCGDNFGGADEPEELELLDAVLPEAWSAAGSGGFDSDTESESSSDGYSVKDLALDFDSDGLFTEREFEAEVGRTNSLDSSGEKEELVECKHKSKATQLPNSLGSSGRSEDFENYIEINLKDLNTPDVGLCHTDSISSPDPHIAVPPDGELCEVKQECKRVHQEEKDQKEAIHDSNHSGEVSSNVGLDSENLAIVQSEKILCEAGRVGSKCFKGEESESKDSREPEGTQLPTSCDVDKESARLGSNNHNRNSNPSYQNLSERGPAATTSRSCDGQEAGAVAEAGLSGTTHSEDDARLQEPQSFEETQLTEESKELSMEEWEELESLEEHHDLIDQLRMELKKARAIGLPTISEESESPRSAEGLKPWKPDVRFLRDDPMDELHKLHKIYRERMKKLDVLNNQKMYAIGFLHLKDPVQSMGTQKSFIPTIASILSQNFLPCRRRKSSSDPSERFIKELQSDLEMVYVGQSCLSWEFLHWQYERTRELLESDQHDSHQYNQVAGEFQQFQVLIQRFLENEPFEGPRVPNYVKSRCVLRSLLQVPLVREDCFKNKAAERRKRNDAITGEQLEYIMEDSIRIFWEFVKSDKDETPLIMKGLLGTQVELQDPTDLELMVDIQAILKQKQKKLKDLLRTGNCVVKKFKKARQGGSNQDELFFSQVDMKLVSRVLKMTRITTDQLVWCHKKLSKITFLDRKLLREPSFFLFPC
uniref:Ribosomal protein L34Ae n=1 Tax=Anthurium amnicola TaxID=1678845 RepID=A0A1D1Y6P6_9ARAE